MPYDPRLVAPMRDEMVRMGAKELKTVAEVDEVLGDPKGTLLVFVNSVCGCAAGNARPGLALALQHGVRPQQIVTVFAGQDLANAGGGITAGPVFSKLMGFALQRYGVPPSHRKQTVLPIEW